MKKLLTLMAVGALVFTASAVNPRIDIGTVKHDLTPKTELVKKEVKKPASKALIQQSFSDRQLQSNLRETVVKPTPKNAVAKEGATMRVMRARKVDSNESIEGLWNFSLGDYYFQTSINDVFEVVFEATLEDDYVIFEDPTGEELPFGATFNSTTGELTFEREYLGTAGQYYIYQEPFVYDYLEQDLALQDITASYVASDGEIVFEDDNGISWPAYNNLAGTQLAGYFGIYDLVYAEREEPGEIVDASTLAGEWEFALGDYYFQTSSNSTIYVTFEATVEGNTVYFEDPTNYELPFVGVYNSDNSTLTFSRLGLGSTGTYYVYQQPFRYASGMQAMDALVGRYNSATGTLSFTADQGLQWLAYTSSTGTGNAAGYFSIYDFEGGEKVVAVDDSADWEDLGMATFMDGWVLPAFDIDQMDRENWYEVPIQQNVNNTNLYRLVNPYQYGPAAEYNQSAANGYIEFDISDPNHVVFNKANAGFANSGLGVTAFYCYNTLGMYVASTGYPADYIVNILGEDAIAYTTYENGIVTLTSIEGDDGTEYDANFGYQADQNGGYVWTGANMNAMIILPGYEFEPGEKVEGTGNMTTQLDMNMGLLDEPELLDPETYEVEASYQNGVLTITNFVELNPISFTINLETGDAVAANQVSSTEDGDDYYFCDVASKETTIYGHIVNMGENKSRLTVDPWGEGMDFPSFGMFLVNAYFNTEVVLNFAIPELEATIVEPVIEIDQVLYDINEEDFTVTFEVTLNTQGLPEDADITLYYQGPNDDDFKAAEPAVDGVYTIIIGGLMNNTTNTMLLYAKSGTVVSETEEVTFSFVVSGINDVDADGENVRYYNLQGVEVKNPAPGMPYIKVNGKSATKIMVK